jgi:hypothetical protein
MIDDSTLVQIKAEINAVFRRRTRLVIHRSVLLTPQPNPRRPSFAQQALPYWYLVTLDLKPSWHGQRLV